MDEAYNIKLIDFGSAAYIPSHPTDYFKTYNGTPLYESPEIVEGSAYRGPEAEIWYVFIFKSGSLLSGLLILKPFCRAMGVLLYTMVFGVSPFNSRSEIVHGQYKLPNDVEEGMVF